MMTFYQIRNIDRFFQVIDTCTGGVFFQTSDGQCVDIRGNTLVKSLLEASGGQRGIEKLDLRAECAADGERLIQFMMG